MLDDFLIRHTPGPTLEIAPSVLAARAGLATAARNLLQVPDSALEAGWPWRDETADVRYGLYRPIEAIEEAAADIGRVLRDTKARRPPGAERIASATAARWELDGLLMGIDEAALDRDPGDGEWPLRETLGHIVSTQRAYAWYTAWWAARDQSEPAPDRVPDTIRDEAPLPERAAEAAGTVADIRERLDAILDLSAGRLAYLDDEGLAWPARWSGIAVDVGFRLGRWSSHLIEHTLQLDKTTVALGIRPTEVERLVRLIHAAYGRLEALVFPMAPAALALADDRGRTVDAVLEALGGELAADASSVRSAAGA
jgi:hypothetical protein